MRYQLPPPEALGLTRQLFDAISNLQGLKPGGKDSTAKKITISRLYAYATGVDGDTDPELERLLAENLAMRGDFRRLLQKTAKWHMPQVAAASTGAISQRGGVNCRIRFEISRAEPEQTYVIIEATDSDVPAPAALFVCDLEDRCDKFPLPRARDGVIQLLLARNSDLLAKLQDINTEIYLG
jgi:hypothetical protein